MSDLTNFSRLRMTGDATGETVLQATAGVVKFHNRPTTDAYVLEVKGEPTSVSGVFFNIESTVDHKPSTATSALGARALGGICRLAATYTMTGGGLIGGYSQICNLGTFNGASIISAAHYALIEDGGVWTAIGHVAAQWLDSHLDKTITAGLASFQYISNNGDTQFDNAWYIYAGNKITNLLTIEATTDDGIVSDPTTADYTFTKWRRVKCNIGGETGYLIVDVP